MDVEPRQYRLRLLNGCDSRYLVVEFIAVDLHATTSDGGVPIDFHVVGVDDGLVTPSRESLVVLAPSQRYDIIFDFSSVKNKRVIIKNTGGDEPFGGDIPGPLVFELTDRIMAFDVVLPLDESVPDMWRYRGAVTIDDITPVDKVRRLGLFEGRDEFNRLQPLLGTLDESKDLNGNTICYPNTKPYRDAGLVGPIIGSLPWHAPTTENIALNAVEDWELWNLSADAHPIHLHLVGFTLVKRELIKFDSAASVDGVVENENLAAGDGTFITPIPIVQHDGAVGEGYRVVNPTKDGIIDEADYAAYVDIGVKDAMVALPGQVTTIRAKFDKPGGYSWHCHIISHEDHEMMRRLHVGELPVEQQGGVCDPIFYDDDSLDDGYYDDGYYDDGNYDDGYYYDDDGHDDGHEVGHFAVQRSHQTNAVAGGGCKYTPIIPMMIMMCILSAIM
jgi:spore coat protein A, manganese oxidase